MPANNITRLTHTYIREHPSVCDCIDRGLVNYSALAREICETLEVDAFQAVLMACRRYHSRNRTRSSQEKRIIALIRRAKLRVKNRIAVAIIDKSGLLEKALTFQKLVRKQRGDFNLIEGEEVFIMVTNLDYVPAIRETFGRSVIKITKGLIQISMVFDEKLETTTGVVSYIYRLFAENDINIREEMSCWTDVMVIVDEKDMVKAMRVLG